MMETQVKNDGEPACKKARLSSVKLEADNTDTENVADSTTSSLEVTDVKDNKSTIVKNTSKSTPSKNSVEADGTAVTTSALTDFKAEKTAAVEASGNSSEASQIGLKLLTEMDVGITGYCGSHDGFSAIIKQRYSDFNVNEIDQDGNVVHLTDMSPPENEEQKDCPASNVKEVDSTVIDQTYKDKLEALVTSGDKSGSVNIPVPDDKDMRTKIHLFVKQTFSQLETKTTEVEGQKVIQAFMRKGKSTRDSGMEDWPSSKKLCRFVKFVLYKENKDTMDAIGLISKLLRIREGQFQFAGTKDKRGRTSQEITANRVHPKKLATLNKLLRNMGVGNFRYVEGPLKLGQLCGNQFTIVLRNVEASNETVDKALTSLKTSGFINYFGMQRFGTTSVPTYKIGSALLHSDWKKAVDLILMPRKDGDPNKAEFQKIWHETGDASKALKKVPRWCGIERNLLDGLVRQLPPIQALDRISRNTRMLYVHSYQALVWNTMVSRRLAQLGHTPVIGDLVIPRGDSTSDKAEPLVLTKDNLEEYTIHDVVLPLPGHSISYPNNEVRGWFQEALKSDGLDIDDMERPQKDYSLPGSYRHLTVGPKDVSWTYKHYDDYTLALTLSDWDILKKETLPEPSNTGKYKAVILQMTLPSSCYATMALREVLKMDTSAAHQTSLNVT